jgi:hypothetical protein
MLGDIIPDSRATSLGIRTDIRNVPNTEEKARLKSLALPPTEMWLEMILQLGEIPLNDALVTHTWSEGKTRSGGEWVREQVGKALDVLPWSRRQRLRRAMSWLKESQASCLYAHLGTDLFITLPTGEWFGPLAPWQHSIPPTSPNDSELGT